MKVTIEFCHVWNYYPRAAGLAEELKKAVKDIDIELIKSSGGVFEVVADGNLIFSKRDSGRFPTPEEIIGQLN